MNDPIFANAVIKLICIGWRGFFLIVNQLLIINKGKIQLLLYRYNLKRIRYGETNSAPFTYITLQFDVATLHFYELPAKI